LGATGALTWFEFLKRRNGSVFAKQGLTGFLQLRQTSLRLIRVRRVGIFFYNLPIKFRSVWLVELLLFELRGIVQIFRFIAAAREQQEQTSGKKSSHENSPKWFVPDLI
jgi:hypothetical protein